MSQRREYFKEIDFIRAICCACIFIYHFSIYTNSEFKPLLRYANGDFGEAFVCVFFIVSGFVTYNGYNNGFSWKDFYTRRIRSIFPSFYLCWIIFYFLKAILHKKLIYIWEEPWKIIFTILGIDGYFLGLYPNFYLVGEWFLGALLFCYLIYPYIESITKKNLSVLVLFLLLTFSIIFRNEVFLFVPREFTRLFEYLLKFYIGVLIRKNYEIIDNKYFKITCYIFVLIYTFVLINDSFVLQLLYGISLFFVLYYIGRHFVDTKVIYFVSSISYQFFLVHHQIIVKILNYVSNPKDVVFQLLIMLITFFDNGVICLDN